MTGRGQIGDYTIIDTVGQGGMGAVLKVRHHQLGVIRALKVMSRPNDKKAQARFERESRNLAGVSHPNLIKIHEANLEPGRAWFAMDLVEGESLKDRLAKAGAFEWRDAVELMIGMCRGVAALHEIGVIHRDIKPSNVMLDPEGRPIVIDLGLALAPSTDERLTRSGAVVGTLRYMPPEAVGGTEPPGAATDVYALGLVLYEMLTGEHAVASQTSWQAQTAAILTESRPGPAQTVLDLPESLNRACLRAMAYECADRYPDAAAFADALETILQAPGPTHRQQRVRSMLAVAAGALLVFALGVALLPSLRKAFEPPAALPTQAPLADAIAPETPELTAEDRREAATLLKELRRESDPRTRVQLANVWLSRFAGLPGSDAARRARAQALYRAPLLRVRHDGGVAGAAFVGADRVLSVARDGKATLWNLPDGAQLRTWRLECGAGRVAASPRGDYALVTGRASELARIDLNRDEVRVFGQIGTRWPAQSIAFHPSGDSVAVAYQGYVNLYTFPEMQELRRFGPHGAVARVAAFSSAGDRLASGAGNAIHGARDNDLSVRIWDYESGEEQLRVGFNSKVIALAFSHDDRLLAVGTGAAKLMIVDTKTGEILADLRSELQQAEKAGLISGVMAHSYTVRGVAFSPTDAFLHSCSPGRNKGGELRLWDTKAFAQLLPTPAFHRPPLVYPEKWFGLALSAAGDRIVLWEEEGDAVEVWAVPH